VSERRSINWDLWTSAALTLVGLALMLDAWTFPRGVRGVPGPAFFPLAIGGSIVALSAIVGAHAWRAPIVAYWDRTGREPILRRMLLLMALLLSYVALWNVVPFLWRTPILLILIYRLFRESWTRAVLLAAALTVALYALFEGVLSIQL